MSASTNKIKENLIRLSIIISHLQNFKLIVVDVGVNPEFKKKTTINDPKVP